MIKKRMYKGLYADEALGFFCDGCANVHRIPPELIEQSQPGSAGFFGHVVLFRPAKKYIPIKGYTGKTPPGKG
jgi:hypothetical protein